MTRRRCPCGRSSRERRPPQSMTTRAPMEQPPPRRTSQPSPERSTAVALAGATSRTPRSTAWARRSASKRARSIRHPVPSGSRKVSSTSGTSDPQRLTFSGACACPAAANLSHAPITASGRLAAPGSDSPTRQPGSRTRSIRATVACGARAAAAAAPAEPAPTTATSTFTRCAVAARWGTAARGRCSTGRHRPPTVGRAGPGRRRAPSAGHCAASLRRESLPPE